MFSAKTIISKLAPLYKDGEEATKIELASFSNNSYNVVVGKNLYKIGDEVILIFPDTQLPEREEFHSYLAPDNDPEKSRLGKVGGIRDRVRAIKFNFSIYKNTNTPVYSEGIIIPNIDIEEDKLDAYLGLFKEEEPEECGRSKGLPRGLSKTDEVNIKKDTSGFVAGNTYAFTEKIDGSSCTILISDEYPEGVITTRTRTCDVTSNDKFVLAAKPALYLLKSTGFNNIALRGECYGGSFNGSGNKLNRMKGKKPSIIMFSVEYKNPKTNIYSRVLFADYVEICDRCGFERVPILRTSKVSSIEEMIQIASDIFDEQKKKGVIIEGVVVRSLEDAHFSKKIMNPEYDSKK